MHPPQRWTWPLTRQAAAKQPLLEEQSLLLQKHLRQQRLLQRVISGPAALQQLAHRQVWAQQALGYHPPAAGTWMEADLVWNHGRGPGLCMRSVTWREGSASMWQRYQAKRTCLHAESTS